MKELQQRFNLDSWSLGCTSCVGSSSHQPSPEMHPEKSVVGRAAGAEEKLNALLTRRPPQVFQPRFWLNVLQLLSPN